MFNLVITMTYRIRADRSCSDSLPAIFRTALQSYMRGGERNMKNQVSPALMVVVIVLVVVGAGFFLWRAATEKPAYPGLNALRPADETATRSEKAKPNGQPMNYEEAKKMRIPGMNPNAPPPTAPSSNPGGQ